MADIAPEIMSRVQHMFNDAFYKDPTIRGILPKIYAEKASYSDMQTLAKRAGELCGEALMANLTADALPDGKLYYNIADKVVGEQLRSIHVQINGLSQKVQEGLNNGAGIGLKPQSVPIDSDRINGIVNAASHSETLKEAHSIIERSTANYTLHVIDEAVRINAQFQYNAGLEPKVSRRTNGKCCKWCSGLAGVYDYEDVSETGSDVWRRHLDCDCVIEYDPGDGKRERVNNYSKRKTAENDPAELLKRRQIQGLPDDRASDKIVARKKVGAKPERLKQPDMVIGRSVGAKSKNYDIMDLTTGEMFHLVEGTRLQDVEVFAGKGVKTPYRQAAKYARDFGGSIENWQHVKGFGVVDYYGEERRAELHWSQCEGIGKVDFFVKEWQE